MEIKTFTFEDEGMGPVYRNASWMVGIKNFKPANALENLDTLERHNKTDELFALLEGVCTLIYANETPKGLVFDTIEMEKGVLYAIPAALWHNTITIPKTKLLLIEAPDTSAYNSDFLTMTREQRETVKKLCR